MVTYGLSLHISTLLGDIKIENTDKCTKRRKATTPILSLTPSNPDQTQPSCHATRVLPNHTNVNRRKCPTLNFWTMLDLMEEEVRL